MGRAVVRDDAQHGEYHEADCEKNAHRAATARHAGRSYRVWAAQPALIVLRIALSSLARADLSRAEGAIRRPTCPQLYQIRCGMPAMRDQFQSSPAERMVG